jgi:hypothetical protein
MSAAMQNEVVGHETLLMVPDPVTFAPFDQVPAE